MDDRAIIPAIIAGILIGVAITKVGGVLNAAPNYSNAMIVLEDPGCQICKPELNRVVALLEKNALRGNIKPVILDVTRGNGLKLYEKIQKESGANLVPLVLFTPDVSKSTLEQVNKALQEMSGRQENITKAGKYYAVIPVWPTRRFAPGKPRVEVTVEYDGKYDINSVKSLLYLSADNVDVNVVKATGVRLKIRAPAEIIRDLAPYFPLARITDDEIYIPEIHARIYAKQGFGTAVANRIRKMGFDANVVGPLESNYLLARVVTKYPDIVAKMFPGSQMESGAVAIPKQGVLRIDAFFAGSNASLLKELNEVVYYEGNRLQVVPHFLAERNGKYVVFPGGKHAFDLALYSYCAYLQNPRAWVPFAYEVYRCDGNCLDRTVKKFGIDESMLQNCVKRAPEILQIFINDEKTSAVTRTEAVIDGWYVARPDEAVNAVCEMLLFPKKAMCEEVNA